MPDPAKAKVGGVGTGSPCIVVPDADAHHARAGAAGARVVYPLKDEDYGGRGYSCRDPEGAPLELRDLRSLGAGSGLGFAAGCAALERDDRERRQRDDDRLRAPVP